MALSALDNPKHQPTEEELHAVLGDALGTWQTLADWLAEVIGTERVEWGTAGKKYGWALRAVRKKRRIVYLIPQHGSFLVGLVLGDKAMDAVRKAKLSEATRETIAAATRYSEGTGFRLPVAAAADLVDVKTLVEIKSRL